MQYTKKKKIPAQIIPNHPTYAVLQKVYYTNKPNLNSKKNQFTFSKLNYKIALKTNTLTLSRTQQIQIT